MQSTMTSYSNINIMTSNIIFDSILDQNSTCCVIYSLISHLCVFLHPGTVIHFVRLLLANVTVMALLFACLVVGWLVGRLVCRRLAGWLAGLLLLLLWWWWYSSSFSFWLFQLLFLNALPLIAAGPGRRHINNKWISQLLYKQIMWR